MTCDGLSGANALFSRRIELISDCRDKEIVALYTSLSEGTIGTAQGTLRTIASTWLLAALAALGYLIQAEYLGDSPVKGAEVACSLRQSVLLVAALGLSALWYLDQRVYQPLLHSVFASGCWLEQRFQHVIPPFRTYMYLKNADITASLGWFYRAPLIALGIGGALNVGQVLWRLRHPIHSIAAHTPAPGTERWWIPLILGVAQAAATTAVLMIAQSWPDLERDLPPDIRTSRREF